MWRIQYALSILYSLIGLCNIRLVKLNKKEGSMQMNEMENQQYEQEIDLLELFRALIENWKPIVVTIVIAALIGFGVTKFLMVPQYEASVNMIVNAKQESNGSLTNDNIVSAKNLVDTYAIILKSNIVLDRVINDLHMDISYEALSQRIQVSSVNNTPIMRVSVRDADPQLAEKIIQRISQIAPSVIVDAVEAGSCKTVSKVSANPNPVSPNTTHNVALAGIIGAIVSMGFVVVRALFQNYIKDDEDIQKYLQLPVLGVIPEIEEVK